MSLGRSVFAGPLSALLALGCSGNDAEQRKTQDILFPAPGSLSAPSGEGGFRFGAASAATQI
jgi:hypothetical protein